MLWFSRKGDYGTNKQGNAPGAGKHSAADPTPSRQSESYGAKHAAKPYQGRHRAGE